MSVSLQRRPCPSRGAPPQHVLLLDAALDAWIYQLQRELAICSKRTSATIAAMLASPFTGARILRHACVRLSAVPERVIVDSRKGHCFYGQVSLSSFPFPSFHPSFLRSFLLWRLTRTIDIRMTVFWLSIGVKYHAVPPHAERNKNKKTEQKRNKQKQRNKSKSQTKT